MCYQPFVLILQNPTCSLLNNSRISRDHHLYPASRVQISASPLQWFQHHRQTKIHGRNSKLGDDTHLKTLRIHYVMMQSRGPLQGHLEEETFVSLSLVLSTDRLSSFLTSHTSDKRHKIDFSVKFLLPFLIVAV